MTLFGALREVRAATLEDPTTPVTSANWPGESVLFGPGATASGVRVTEKSALGMSAVWRALSVASSVPASLPLHAFRSDGDARVRAAGHAADLLESPHPDMTQFEVIQLAFLHRRTWGNAYLRILRNRLGQVAELWPIHPSRVRVGRESEAGRKVYVIDGDVEHPLSDEQILHIPGMGYDGVCGVSPIRAARNAIGLGLAAEDFGGKLFGNGTLATGILQTEQRLTQKQADALAARWKQKRSGLSSAHETIVLDKGASFTQLTIPPQDAQFLETRRFQTTEICRFFGLPPFLMFETEKSTSWGTGLEQQMLGWVAIDLRPDLVSFEQRLTRILRPEKVYARFGLEGLLRGDSAARAAFYTAMWNIGVLSTDEIRALEELGPVEGGDVRYRPLNMGELGTTDGGGTDTPPADPGPAAPAEPLPPSDRIDRALAALLERAPHAEAVPTVNITNVVQPAEVAVAPIPAPVVNLDVEPTPVAVEVRNEVTSPDVAVQVEPKILVNPDIRLQPSTRTIERDAEGQIVRVVEE